MSDFFVTTLSSTSDITAWNGPASWTCSDAGFYVFQARLSSLDANPASVTARLQHLSGADAVLAESHASETKAKLTGTDTTLGFALLGPIYLASGEKARVLFDSDNASDTAAACSVRVLSSAASPERIALAVDGLNLASQETLTDVKDQTDKFQFTGDYVKASVSSIGSSEMPSITRGAIVGRIRNVGRGGVIVADYNQDSK